ncbi:ribosomal protein L7Ae, partial [Opisthorchis viverrini]
MVDDSEVVLDEESGELSYEQKIQFACAIANPMASEKLAKRLHKLVRKARRNKKAEFAVKSIVKSIEKKKAVGLLIIAGDISPIDSISHLPIICEEHNIPYCYVPSRMDLGASAGSVGPIMAAFIERDEQYGDLYDKCHALIDALPLPI